MATMPISLSPLAFAGVPPVPAAWSRLPGSSPQGSPRCLVALFDQRGSTLPVFQAKDKSLRIVDGPASHYGDAIVKPASALDPARAAEQERMKRLVLLCLSGDAAAWEQLVNAQHRRIYAICYRFTGSPTDAEDLTQDVFLKLYRSLSSFDPGKGAFSTWLTTLTRNLLVDHFRRTRQDRATDSLDVTYGEDGDGPTKAEQLADTRRNQHDTVAGAQLRARIQHALSQLSPELREAVILRDLQDMDYREIADVLGVPEGTVKSRISRGRGELARVLGREGLNSAGDMVPAKRTEGGSRP